MDKGKPYAMEMNTKKQKGRCTVNKKNSGEKSRDGEYEKSSTAC